MKKRIRKKEAVPLIKGLRWRITGTLARVREVAAADVAALVASVGGGIGPIELMDAISC